MTDKQTYDATVENIKQILETYANLSFDPESANYILKRIGDTTTTIAVEGSQAFVRSDGTYPNKSRYVRVSTLPESTKTPNYLKSDGTVDTVRYTSSVLATMSLP